MLQSLRRSAILLLLALLSVVRLHAQFFVDWHESIVATPGRGVDPRNPDTIKPSVAVIDLSQVGGYCGTGDALFTVHFSQHQFDLVRHFALNASLSAKYGAYSGRVNFGMVDNTTHSGNTLNFVFVGNRDFGQTHHPVATLSPQFIADVNYYKSTGLRGVALGKAVEDRYGTHYYTGHKSAAKVVVNYTFTFDSQTTTRSLTASLDARYRGGLNSASFHTDVASFLGQNDSRVTLNYRFYSSDPIQLPDFPVTAAISNLTQFLEFSAKVENYCKGLDPARGKRTGYVVEKIQNLPGYLALLEGYNPADRFNTDYDRWLEAYGKLKQWDDTLTGWCIDPRRMSWMNTNGQRLVQGMRRDVANYRRTLKTTARRHFDTGEPLVVPDEIFNYFANFSRIPLPSINIVRHIRWGADNHTWIGFVNAGPIGLVTERPFQQLIQRQAGYAEAGNDIVYSANAFESVARQFSHDVSGTVISEANQLFNSEYWTALRADQAACRIGFFIAWWGGHPIEQVLTLKDGAGQVVEEVSVNEVGSGICAAGLEVSPLVELSVSLPPLPGGNTVDALTAYEYSITNLSLSPTYGNVAMLPIPVGMELLAVNGSQGFGTVTNGQVLYEIGPLAYGSSATIRLDLVPLRTGVLTPATPATVTVGDGLVDSNPANNTVLPAPITVTPPLLAMTQRTDGVELIWVSETGRTTLQSAAALNGIPSWRSVTNAPVAVGSTRTVRLPATGASKFFRLRFI